MQRISLNTAKVLKEAGYPQPQPDVWGYINRPNDCYFTGRHSYWDENRERRLEWDETNELHTADDWADEIEPSFYGSAIAAPTYFEVWLWLWREKGFRFELAHPEYKGEYDFNKLYCNVTSGMGVTDDYSDPEEAIVASIEYLVNNNLIKD